MSKLNLLKKPSAAAKGPSRPPWRILVVDDDPEVHAVTRLALKGLDFGGRGIDMLHAENAASARQLLAAQADIAIILLDVVMETDDAGLRLTRYIRDELRNLAVRIVLRTGQPGQAPEEEVIVKYDVNDYKSKTELTARRLFTTTVTALRTYEHLMHLDAHRRGLQQIIDAGTLFNERSPEHFAARALQRLAGFAGAGANGVLCLSDGDSLEVLADGCDEDLPVRHTDVSAIEPEMLAEIKAAFERKSHHHGPIFTTLYLNLGERGATVACLRCTPLDAALMRPLIELLCSKIEIGFNNVHLYERLTQANSRLEAKVEDRTRQLLELNEELRRRASIDALTGLPNRPLLEDRLSQAATRCDRERERLRGLDSAKLAVLFIDLDGFKPINDSFGHAAGDIILKEVASRLRATARASDTPARIGGDEFLLLMEGVTSVADCVCAARRLLEALAQPFVIAERQVQITASIGIAVYPEHGAQDKLIASADAGMYAAKRAGGNTFAVFEKNMDAGALELLCLQNELRGAAERGELELHYQPKVNAGMEKVSGMEALLRWCHPQRGLVEPSAFIPVAERFGLINSLGDWVINEACRQMREWAATGTTVSVAVNLSMHQLRQDDLVDRIDQTLQRHQVPASQLLCEITESVAMEDIRAVQKTFDGLARIGVYLSIDDFGTGYSSLSYLRQLPARQLKIDRSFVNDLASSDDAAAVVKAVIHLAHALGLHVVAEGVETEAQRDVLLQLGCDQLQGYLFARPMPAHLLPEWLNGFLNPQRGRRPNAEVPADRGMEAACGGHSMWLRHSA